MSEEMIMVEMVILEKQCAKCGEIKAVGEFYRHKRNKDGLQIWCKCCNIAYRKAYYQANPDKVKAGKKAYYQANPEKYKTYMKAWYQANMDKVKAGNKAYYQANPDKAKAWQQANPEKCSMTTAKRRAIKQNQLHPDHNPIIEQQLFAMAKRLENCLKIKFHVDHIWPISQGGPHHHANLQVIPQTLNLQKHINLTFEHPLLRDWTDIPLNLLQWIKTNHLEKFKKAVKMWCNNGRTLDDFRGHLITKAA